MMQAKIEVPALVWDVTFVWIVLVSVIFLLYIELYTLVLFMRWNSHTLLAFLWPTDLFP